MRKMTAVSERPDETPEGPSMDGSGRDKRPTLGATADASLVGFLDMPLQKTLAPSKIRRRYWFGVGAILAAFNLVTFNRYFPLSEGWWEAYGYLYNSGLRPYRDFDLAFTPLFTIINAVLLRVFGDSFFAIRLFGVVVFVGAAFLLQLVLEELFSPKVAAVAILMASFLVIGEGTFIAKDYHFYQLLFTAAALLLHLRLIRRTDLTPRQQLLGTAAVAVIASLVFFLKQNVGGLLIVAIAASLPFVDRQRPIARLLAYAGGGLFAAVALAPIVSPSDWRALLLGNDAKGSIGTVLLRVWREPPNREALLTASRLCVAYVVLRYALAPPQRWGAIWSDGLKGVAGRPLVRNGVLLLAAGVVAASGNAIRLAVIPWIIPVSLALLLILLGRVARKAVDRRYDLDPRVVAVALPLAALAYANTNTAIFDFNGMLIPVAVGFAWVLASFEALVPVRYWLVAALACLIIVPELAAKKLRTPYSWWGIKQPSIAQATEKAPYDQLAGMRISARDRDNLAEIKRAVDAHSRDRKDVLFYNLPMFYWLHDKLPPYRTVIQWFDVVTSKQLEADLRAMRERPPRVVVALEPPPVAFWGHKQLRRAEHLPQEDFRDWMDEGVRRGDYRLIRTINLPNTYENEPFTQDVSVQLESAIGGTPTALLQGKAEGVTVLEVACGEGVTQRPCRAPALTAGDVITLRGTAGSVRTASELIGIARGEPRDWYTVNIYVRADAL